MMENQITGITFRKGIEAKHFEVYKGVTILYVAKSANTEQERIVYHLFVKNNEVSSGEEATLEQTMKLAQRDVDSYLSKHPIKKLLYKII